jgi:A/G-specific adenine glycosylase
VLRAWKGLGYNSRALRMKKTAEIIVKNHKGVFPKDYEQLLVLPGIGPYTAGAICAFAYNQPVVMIETNIRRVFIHHFWNVTLHDSEGQRGTCAKLGLSSKTGEIVHDRDILKLVQETLDLKNPREWYWALMDYGSYLGKTIPNPNKKSRHYTVQKKFKGSDREIRGRILEIILEQKKIPIDNLLEKIKILSHDDERILRILADLEQEGFLKVSDKTIMIIK